VYSVIYHFKESSNVQTSQQLFLCHDLKPSPGNPVSANNQVPNDLPPHVPIVTVVISCKELKQESSMMSILTIVMMKDTSLFVTV
jgi:hypothetical protein